MIEDSPIRIGNQTASAAADLMQPFHYALANEFDAFEWFPDKKPWGGGWEESDLSREERHAIRDVAKARNMRLSVHAHWEANPLKPEAHRILLKDLELAKDLGAALLNIHLYAEQGLAVYVDSIAWLLERLADAGIQLAIENTPLTSPEQFNELFARLGELDSVPTNQVGMCLDLGHANLYASTRNDYLGYFDQLDEMVPVNHLHVHENWGDSDSHLTLFTGPARTNPAGVCGFLERVLQRHYSGSIILEQWPHPPSLLSEARQRLKELISAYPSGG
jgi:sugar phosphate isomerase/epimerase